MNTMGMNGNMLLQPMYMQQHDPQNRIQQQAQSQMNNLRQQVAALQQPMQGMAPTGVIVSNPGVNGRDSEGSPITNPRMNGARSRMVSLQGVQLQFPQQNMETDNTLFAQQPVGQNLVHMSNNPNSIPNGNGTMNGANVNLNMAQMGQSMLPASNLNALQDYQMQLMLLEKQNKKRLDIARVTGGTDGNGIQMSIPVGQPPHMKASPVPSPSLNTKSSPNPNSLASTKKPVKRNRKLSASSNAASPHTSAPSDGPNNGSNSRAASNAPKKEYVSPLTPAAESDSKKKRKNTGGEATTKKAAKPAVKKEKATPKLKKAVEKGDAETNDSTEKKLDSSDSSKMPPPPPGGSFYQNIGNEKVMNVDILGSGGNPSEGNFFGTGGNSSIDDVDFGFNLFLDGGDVGLNDDLTGFNWGNPIEGND